MTVIEAALATKHGKLAQIAPAFAELLDWQLVVAEIDTDEFGSFDGTKPRVLSPRETVLAKARAGAEFLGLRFGLASEGTIGPHPEYPLSTADAELIGLVDTELGTELVVSFVSPKIVAQKLDVTTTPDPVLLAEKFDLPNHAVNLKIQSGNQEMLLKGIFDPHLIIQEIAIAKRSDADARILLESDFRAMSSPSRQLNIAECAKRAAKRISRFCPSCNYLGFGQTGFEYGVQCVSCGTLNQQIAAAEIHGCLVCEHSVRIDRGLAHIEADRCLSCNP